MVADRRSLEKACGTLKIARKPGLYIFTCLSCGGGYRKRKIGDLAVPVAAASQIAFSREADRIQLKSGVGIPEKNKKKVAPRTGYLICGPGQQVRRFSHQ
jgi:hypothetical protein